MAKRKTDTIELKKIMVEKRLDTIQALSEASGISRNTLGPIINGNKNPTSEVIYKLISTLEIPPTKAGEIFFGTNLHN